MANATVTRRSSTRDNTDLVRVYLDEIGATPLLTATEEVELAKRIEAGVYAAELITHADAGGRALPADRRDLEAIAHDGELAKDHMIRANLRLVVTAARKSRNTNLPLLDAVQEGNLGLLHAVEKFDYAKGFKFSTYAMWWIRQAIQKGNAFHSNTIRLPMHTAEQVAKLDRLQRALEASGQTPTVEELAEAAGMPVEKVVALRKAGQSTVSLDVPLDEDGELSLGDLVTAGSVPEVGEALEHELMVDDLNAALDTLEPAEATVVSLRYGLADGNQHTVPDIARRLGVTRKRVRALEEHALTQLRDPERHKPLLAWAG
ncbi:sigma-70 family RNA polymerase sigma factor [Prauserella cavernicola]|uniref:Sigma-70 family RNA polymerase sigma factor n=1 Tax=Prauserella cavernicola TaxID=2800127 RepID=A0A934V8X2_9PSEU|nr:sigma-70 family RNA polymerase sigma factor [Prauserella cavernicola]MBK1789114.1 sigma-70 family RNA polymerase sigma factor [Prauserella cavernicola]